MLCYRCGSHVPDTAAACARCGQALAPAGSKKGGAPARRKHAAAQSGASHSPGDVIAERYVVKAVVGEGPAGYVYRCTDEHHDAELALKVVHGRLVQSDDDRVQFSQSLHRAKQVDHENVAKIFDEGLDGNRPYFAARFVDGLSLRKMIDLRESKGEVFTPEEIEPILAQLAAGLDAIHASGTPHGAVKPENVIILPERLALTDTALGVALPRLPYLLSQRSRKADRYAAPEFAQNGELTPAADVYSLGAILGELLAGVVPDGSIPELRKARPGLAMPLEGLYRKALSPAPRSRFKSASELHRAFVDALARAASETIVDRLPPPVPDEPVVPVARPTHPLMPSAPGAETMTMDRPQLGELSLPSVVVADEPATRSEQTVSERPSGSAPRARGDDARQEELPIDATRPMDADDLSAIGGQQQRFDDPTQALPQPDDLPSLVTAAPRRRAARDRTWLWLGALTVAGLLVGALGGYLILRTTRAQPTVTAQVDSGPDLSRPPPRLDRSAPGEPRPRAPSVAATEHPVANGPAASNAAEPKADAPEPAAPSPKLAEPARPTPSRAEARPASAAGPGCPPGMILVPAGSFRIGTAANDPMRGFDDQRLATVEQGAYCIDPYEYPGEKGSAPRTNLTWSEAKRLCEQRGKRLCSEREWEKACKGPGSERFPYGPRFDADRCNTERTPGADRTLAASGEFARCRSGYGVFDLSGNAAEWTATPIGAGKAQKGGSYANPDYAARCSARASGSPFGRSPEVGFRCCADVR